MGVILTVMMMMRMIMMNGDMMTTIKVMMMMTLEIGPQRIPNAKSQNCFIQKCSRQDYFVPGKIFLISLPSLDVGR